MGVGWELGSPVGFGDKPLGRLILGGQVEVKLCLPKALFGPTLSYASFFEISLPLYLSFFSFSLSLTMLGQTGPFPLEFPPYLCETASRGST